MKLVEILFRYHGVIKRRLLHANGPLEGPGVVATRYCGTFHWGLPAGPLPVGWHGVGKKITVGITTDPLGRGVPLISNTISPP